MSKEIKYLWGDDHLMITLGNRTEPRIRILYLAEFVFTMSMATVFLVQALPLNESLAHWVAAVGSAIIYLLASYRFFARILYSEELLLTRYDLTITRKTPFTNRSRSYDWDNMGVLHYAGKAPKTDHPLKGKSFDYFGFETHEHLIQSLHHDGNLCFMYDGYTVSFARGVYSWDAEEMVRIMKLYVGSMLRLGPEWELMLQEQEEMGDN